MSKCTDIRDICGDYAFDVLYSSDNTLTLFSNSRRNAETVKKCIELDDSIPNFALAVDFVEVVRCKDCKFCHKYFDNKYLCERCFPTSIEVTGFSFCSFGLRRCSPYAEN